MTSTFRCVVSCCVLATAFVLLQIRSTGEAIPLRQPLERLPGHIGQWEANDASTLSATVINILNVKDYVIRRYTNPAGHNLWLYIGYWDTQRRGAQIHSPKNCLPGAGWEPLEASRATIVLPPPYSSITVNSYLVQKDRAQQLVFYWYQAQGRAVAGELAARLQMVQSAIQRNRTEGALVRVSSPVYESVPHTAALLTSYIQDLYPLLGQYLPE